jgi:ATP-dependent DNA helicase DinG
MLAELYSSRPAQTGFLARLKYELSKFTIDKTSSGIVDEVVDSIVTLQQASSDFFEKLSANLNDLGTKSDGKEIRITSGMNPCESNEREELITAFDKLSGRLDDLIDSVREYDELPEKREKVVRLEAFAGDLKSFRDKAFRLMYLEDAHNVYWIETPFSARFAPSIVSAPLEVGKLLNERFYDYIKTGILTSATLAVKGDFAYFLERLGLHLGSKDRTVSLLLESPFDLDSEVAVITAGFLPSPKSREFEYSAIEALKLILTGGARKSLVLFTSHSSLGNAADQLNESLKSAGIELFRQRGTYNSEAILNRFKSSDMAVLFGTDTFWEGVDLPGPLLELLVLFKLPFTVPDRPWFKANLEKIESDGQSSFASLSLPDAVVRFRQGFGRLIRTADDRGCVVILDSRVDKTSFGPAFIKSVRGTKFRPTTALEMAGVIREWLKLE